MKILTIDTSTNVFSIALSQGTTLLAAHFDEIGKAASAKIPMYVETLLQTAGTNVRSIDAFAVTVGPGAFTGVRVGIAFVKGLALATGRPVIALSSLELLAMNAKGSDLPVCAMFDARKGEVYAAIYDLKSGMQLLRPESAIAPEKLLDELKEPMLFIGDGALRYREMIIEKLGTLAYFTADDLNIPKASAGIPLAYTAFTSGNTTSPLELQPRYHRLSEAEVAKKESCVIS
ncbi:MAG: tRNA (adenosine(37)-N6)-threonylcarbamoyltransferase complex dimerization subunit type 1 TsaB [Geobacteraceae bacterium]|nr:tRNA (adenosine(37)-N6)-threonylcarbamoyltransferase complex dimerization subunit type 1 TsaB [Geobacteraceae bacterium]